MATPEPMETAIAYVRDMLEGKEGAREAFADSPVDDLAVHVEDYSEINPLEVLSEALAQSDLDPEAQEAVMAAATASATATATATATAEADGGYSIEEIATIFAEGIKVEVNNTEFTNNVDNSIYAEGDIKNLHQENDTNIVNADDGAIAAGNDQYGQFQTGDGQQVDHADGPVTQGDISGQVAGHDATADNVQSGDYNTAASDQAVLGDENVQAHDIKESEFGKGDLNHDESANLDVAVTESFNQTDNSTDDDYVKVDVDVDKGGYGHEEPEYKPEEPAYEEVKEEHYDEPEHKPEPEYLDD